MSNNDASALRTDRFTDAAMRSQKAGIANEMAAFDSAAATGGVPSIDEGDPANKKDGSRTRETGRAMQIGPEKMSDDEVIALAEAERDAGVPDIQTAEAAAKAQQRMRDKNKPEAHPS